MVEKYTPGEPEKAMPFEFTDARDSREFLKAELQKKEAELMQMTPATDPLDRAAVQVDLGEILLDIGESGMKEAAWGYVKESFEIYLAHEQYEDAVRCCDFLYRTEMPASIVALGNGMWLSVTYPVAPDLSILMMNNLIDDTPEKSDGAAVAAAVAHYIADLRLEGEERDSMMFLTSSMLGKVAERHSDVDSQEKMNFWMEKLELNDPAKFLPRMSQVIDAIVAEDWWYDRDELRTQLPVN